eukprot:2540270-Rhodomonas_salina.2
MGTENGLVRRRVSTGHGRATRLEGASRNVTSRCAVCSAAPAVRPLAPPYARSVRAPRTPYARHQTHHTLGQCRSLRTHPGTTVRYVSTGQHTYSSTTVRYVSTRKPTLLHTGTLMRQYRPSRGQLADSDL